MILWWLLIVYCFHFELSLIGRWLVADWSKLSRKIKSARSWFFCFTIIFIRYYKWQVWSLREFEYYYLSLNFNDWRINIEIMLKVFWLFKNQWFCCICLIGNRFFYKKINCGYRLERDIWTHMKAISNAGSG